MICCNHVFAVLFRPQWNSYLHKLGDNTLKGVAQVVLNFFENNIGNKKRYLAVELVYWWSTLVIHMKIMPLSSP